MASASRDGPIGDSVLAPDGECFERIKIGRNSCRQVMCQPQDILSVASLQRSSRQLESHHRFLRKLNTRQPGKAAFER